MDRRTFLAASAAAAAVVSGRGLAEGGLAANDAVRRLAAMLDDGYVIPAVGRRYASTLRSNLAAAAYTSLTEPAALAERLTADLQAVSPDRHLRVVVEATLPAGAAAGGRSPGVPAGMAASRAPRSGRRSIEDAGWLANGMAYIRFTGFPGDDGTVSETTAFMSSHASARALIIDCRYNGGGGLAEMNAILPFLFGRQVVVARMEMAETVAKARGGTPFDGDTFMRPSVSATRGVIAREHVVSPLPAATPLRTAQVYYLTSGGTASAAEHLALVFRHTRRATLIGETTAGANHFGDFQPIGDGLAVFLPVGRTVDPVTGEDWEGRGLLPDVAIAPTLALQEAMRRSREIV